VSAGGARAGGLLRRRRAPARGRGSPSLACGAGRAARAPRRRARARPRAPRRPSPPNPAGVPQPGGLAALFGGGGGAGDGELRDAAREQQLAASGLPHVVVKAGAIRDVPGGASALSLSGGGGGGGGGAGGGKGGSVSREDLAGVLARLALDVQLPEAGSSTVVVTASGPGQPPEDWVAALQPLVSP
jgi:hypothetical protein